LLMSLVVIGTGSGSLFAQSAEQVKQPDTTGLERYVKKVIVDAKWGSKPDEFQWQSWRGRIGSLVVDNKGIIYIPDLDPDVSQCRIMKFNANGKYIGYIPGLFVYGYGVDDEGNIYVPETDLNGIHIIKKYSPKGQLIRTYQIEVDPWGGPNKYGLIIGAFPKIKNGELILDGLDGNLDGKRGIEYVIGGVNRVYSKEEQKERTKPIFYEVNRELKEMDGEYVFETMSLPDSTQILIKIPNEISHRFLNKEEPSWVKPNNSKRIKKKVLLEPFAQADKYGNGFVYAFYPVAKGLEVKEVWKFSPQWKFLARFPIGNTGDMQYFCEGSARNVVVDDEGNLYWLRALKEGVQVIKYERVR